MFKLFQKKPQEEHIYAPLKGEAVAIEAVPDPTFAEKMMGDGIAIKPVDGKLVAPFDGEVIQVFPTKHAIGLRGTSGLELLIHIGLETVSLNGKGFEAAVKAGDKVKKGDPLITFNLAFIKEWAADSITSIVITNGEKVKSLEKKTGVEALAGETEIMTAQL
ncbi:putative phosphotransferase enzyme IIA component YpqE [Weizmannia acidilactici]|uniref:Phosphotransferase enzyme IIA component YpqE n=1 Tax=Weizmannia acidilactici TaxID=2607726 RepID=A0A5J4JGP6_9BACI|nr:PTS glucose transporter subunit IIA [Weizmannia acidilactici]GER67536.1 putative phosphotransferase enzyme IIA component YpqE [Weizmannia acidilactici]GER71263.1 putative phosphotransferase enzyme IIA component YpqE [Weizmannia acidilactici]GER74697.1 putative phosphotransferase enzyme IIA component YpqE [Weizmannia acidilactici]